MPRSHRQSVVDRLRQDPTYAVDYVNSALEDGDDSGFLKALRNVAESKQMSKVAAQADVERESLYRMLSENGNPRLSSLLGILKALDLRLVVAPQGTVEVGFMEADAGVIQIAFSSEDVVNIQEAFQESILPGQQKHFTAGIYSYCGTNIATTEPKAFPVWQTTNDDNVFIP